MSTENINKDNQEELKIKRKLSDEHGSQKRQRKDSPNSKDAANLEDSQNPADSEGEDKLAMRHYKQFKSDLAKPEDMLAVDNPNPSSNSGEDKYSSECPVNRNDETPINSEDTDSKSDEYHVIDFSTDDDFSNDESEFCNGIDTKFKDVD